MLNKLLFKPIDNSSLIVFRVLFGLLIALESFGAIFTGWIQKVLIEPKFTFSFIGLEWLQPLPGSWMYLYYMIMGICGLMVMLGFKYRFSIISFLILWSGTYLMQKTSYNNHYYLLILISALMSVVPANSSFSIDSYKKPRIRNSLMPQWCVLVFIFQMWIVYTYASIAKLYPDWLDTTVVEILLKPKSNYFLIGDLLQQKWMHFIIIYFGIIFDLLIVPLLLWKKSRRYAFFIAIIFHLFNSIVFQIGVFPYLSLAMCIFFFDTKTIRNLFFKKKGTIEEQQGLKVTNRNLIKVLFISYFIVQLVLPLRHWVIKDDVLWTEEGHRLSWRMMLRTKQGAIAFKVVDENNLTTPILLNQYLSLKQQRHVASKPDMIWQFAQFLKQKFKKELQRDVKVFVNCEIKVNGKPFQQLIDPDVDLASVEWNAFNHSWWILPSKQD